MHTNFPYVSKSKYLMEPKGKIAHVHISVVFPQHAEFRELGVLWRRRKKRMFLNILF